MRTKLFTVMAVLLVTAVWHCSAAIAGDGRQQATERAAGRAARMLLAALKQELTGALQEGGPVAAINICARRAQALTASIPAQAGLPGLRIRRTSLRCRNAANRPGPAERRALEVFERQVHRGETPAPVAERRQDLYRYYVPIQTAPLCLVCHGRPGEIDAGVLKILRERYPDDNATGFSTGDLRGMVSVTVPLSAAAGENNIADYPETIAVLQELYRSEIIASRTYSGFARKAAEEKYYCVARLFRALSESETVHAGNFKTILNELGLEPEKFPEPDSTIADTRTNLNWALKVELSEIDTNYPKLITRIKPEGNRRALEDITYAWKSEMQHRDLIKKMKSGLGLFFGKIVEKLKKAKEYHVCRRCGSTVFKLPEKTCIICGSPVSLYKKTK